MLWLPKPYIKSDLLGLNVEDCHTPLSLVSEGSANWSLKTKDCVIFLSPSILFNMATAILNPGMGSRLETDKDSRPYISLKRLPDPEVSTGSSKAHVFSQSERPEIGYLPDEQNFQERAARLAAQGDLSADSSRPAGFPERMEGPRVWSGKDLGDEDSYAVHLTPSDIEEVEAALESFKGTS